MYRDFDCHLLFRKARGKPLCKLDALAVLPTADKPPTNPTIKDNVTRTNFFKIIALPLNNHTLMESWEK